MRFFNTAGPVNPQLHYCLPPLERIDLAYIQRLIKEQKYFVLHAPRQVGKTTFLLALMAYLNQTESVRCLYVNVESAQVAREDVHRGMQAILNLLATMAQNQLGDSSLEEIRRDILQHSSQDVLLFDALSRWSLTSSKPIVLLMDEIDALVGDTLISVLRQIRTGYTQRPTQFPQSIILCGVRDVRDYRIYSSKGKEPITGGSTFNIKATSLRLGDFLQGEVAVLLAQHTQATGQAFTPEALSQIWHLTQGQPWLVNALAQEICFEMVEGQDRSRPLSEDMVIRAKEALIMRRETHLDQLVDKLKEDRVRRVLEPILAGESSPEHIPTDDVLYVRDLGLIKQTSGQLTIANPIYQEIIPREITYSTQLTISHQTAWYVQSNGRLDVNSLLTAFQQFFREHSEHWLERFAYKEAGPQLLLQAFLQRIINGGGRVEREYGLGRKQTDLLLVWPTNQGVQRVVLELKMRERALEPLIEEGLAQTWDYMDKTGSPEGHLIIFDRSENRSWEEKIFRQERSYHNKTIVVWGM